MSNKQLDGWNENETIEFFMSNRKTYSDLYESEKYFLTDDFISNIDTVLDVGCSVGGMFNVFQSLNNNIQYTGLDVSKNAIDKAKKLNDDRFTNFYHYDGVSKFPMDKKYNLVFSSGVMHLIDNYKYIFRQMVESSKDYLLVDFRLTTSKSYTGKFYFTYLDKREASNYTNYHVLNFKELMDFFAEFKEISQVYVYGYKGKASEMSENIDEVYMVFFKIKLDSNINDKIDIKFENEELKKYIYGTSMRIVVTANAFSKNEFLRESLKKQFPDVVFNDSGKRLSKEELISFLENADGAIVGLDKIDDTVLSKLNKLKIIAKYGVGLDNIDQDACKRHEVSIGWTGGVNRLSVAEMTLGFMLSLSRNLYQTSSQLSVGNWNKSGGMQLSGKTIGIIGVGYIGKEVIRLLEPFSCKILVNDIIDQEEYYELNNLHKTTKNDIFKNSDIITVHTPLTKETKYLINKDTLAMMKPTAYIINTARGAIVNQDDLKYSLQNNLIAGAAIDAYETEPAEDIELLSLNNFFCTPHIGGNSKEAVIAMGESAIEHLTKYFYKR